MNQERIKSPVLWAAIVAQVVSILLALNIIPPALGDKVNEVGALILQLFVLFGVMNNPTDHEGF